MMSDELWMINIDDINTVPGLDDMIVDLVESWFADAPLNTHDFLDRLDEWLYSNGYQMPSQIDDPTIKTIMRRARQIKKELN
jgi:hypothetical protein